LLKNRNKPSRLVLLGAGALALCITFLGVLAAAAAPSAYTFDGAPAAPQPAANSVLADWDVQVHSRDSATWLQMEAMDAQHGVDCGAPPATHHVSGNYDDAVFQCKDHFMTAINSAGYGVIYLTPPEMMDFSSGSSTLSFDASTLRQSSRDWLDVWITPYADNLTLPFDMGDVDLQGVPRQGVHVAMSMFNGETTFRCYQIDNFVETEVTDNWWDSLDSRLAAAGRAPSGSQRDTFQLVLSSNHLKFSSTTIPGWVGCDSALSQLNFTKGVVQLGHHSYNPTKDGSGEPQTRHWDNVSISPAAPLTIIRADRRYVNSSSQTLSFKSAAPSGASLRFSGNGNNIEVSYDGGTTWTAARLQPAQTNVDRFKGYFTPIPQGTTSVKLRGADTFNGPFFTQDFAIFAAGGASAPTSSATQTSTPTKAPATSTPTNAPSTATATVPPTKTPTTPPTFTPTTAPKPAFTVATSASLSGGSFKRSVSVSSKVKANVAATGLVDVEIYSPSGKRVYQKFWDAQNFAANQTLTLSTGWSLPSNAERGTYTVKVGVFATGWSSLYVWQDSATTFVVR
jgi:hypothetical protein